jgi:hypothetical protein
VRAAILAGDTDGRGIMFLMWIAGVWLGTNIAVVAARIAG